MMIWSDSSWGERWRKRWPKVTLLLALAAVAVAVPFDGGWGNAIEATGWGTIEAIQSQDAERVATYFIEEIREEVTFSMEVVFAIVDEIKISNARWEVLSETEDTATVDIEIDWEATAFGETRNGHAKESIDLEKVGREWLINDFAPFQWLIKELSSFEFE